MAILEFAINMEHEGEKYYLEQAEINKDNGLDVVFRMLAKDEHKHAEVLQNKANNLAYKLDPNETLTEIKNVFKGIGDFKDKIKQIPNQLDAYRKALKTEKESIDLYQTSLAEATDDKSKELFEFLIKQEQDHYTALEELVSLLSKSEEWVEDAEFGLRKDY
ncbi:ferritin family protein [Desulfitobacterium sp.]|uniref:ferritin-like domain-containing protein n=1 Tax=Desulfitobacterium sp. TaxID=49981 RepID=UPI002C040D38|nr:ferritin family protein [Desulfitobacterium sp.]HVJ49954.1 ferritin family protein [Desulfitobacterium sp.]